MKDRDGGYIHPLQVQSMIGPMIQAANKLSSYNNPLPALQQIEEGKKPQKELIKDLPEGSIHPYAHEIKELHAPTQDLTQMEKQAVLENFQKQVNELTLRDLKEEIRIPVKDEDIVIALPLSHWPKTIWNSSINRLPKCLKNDREAFKVEKHLLITNFSLYSYSIFNFHLLCVSIMRSFFKKRNKAEHYLKKHYFTTIPYL